MAGWDQPLDEHNGSDLADRLGAIPDGNEFSLGNDKWIIKKSFDHGPTSTAVKLVFNQHRKEELLVCKAVRPKEGKTTRQVPNEVRILLDILPKMERLCAIREYFPAPDNVFLMEFCDGGDLNTLSARYRERDEFLPESFLWHVLLQGAQGLAYIHHGHGQTSVPKHKWSPIIHADIKPDNIFLHWRPGCDPDRDYPDLKLGDFGLSIIVNERTDEPPYFYKGGTHTWKPPEQPLVTFKADVWSLGAVIHHLCHGREPGEIARSDQKAGGLTGREVTPISKYYSRALQYWFEQVLEKDRAKRIDSAVLADSLAGIVPVFLKHREPLDTWAASRTLDQGSTPPTLRRRWHSRDQPSQEYAEYVYDHSSLSFALGDDADLPRQPSQEPEADDTPRGDNTSWPPPDPQ
ncbi:hypothetical protein MMC18_000056 [Xylographa bjoerkii]|nr:hypothetical protein [Xylographa bjoerkii]